MWDTYALLKIIYNVCKAFRDGQALALRVHQRLQDLLQDMAEYDQRGVLLRSELLAKYTALAEEVLHFLQQYQRKNVIYRICTQSSTSERIQHFHEDIDQFFKHFQLAMGAEIMAFKTRDDVWKEPFAEDTKRQIELLTALAGNPVGLLKELNTLPKQQEAVVVWYKAAGTKEGQQPVNAIAGRAYDTLLRHSQHLAVPTPEPWFLYETDIDIDDQPIGRGPFSEVILGVWNGHTFILKMFGACDVSDTPFIVCEFAPHGSLDTFLLANHKNERYMWRLLYEAAQGLHFLYRHSVIHGDLKCNNILVGGDGHAKLADFRMSFLRTNSSVMSTRKQTAAVRWKAPECMGGKNPTVASDWYAFGMCILEAASGRVPWANVLEDTIVIDNVKRGKMPARPENASDDAWELIQALCKTNTGARWTGNDVLLRLQPIARQQGCDYPDGQDFKDWRDIGDNQQEVEQGAPCFTSTEHSRTGSTSTTVEIQLLVRPLVKHLTSRTRKKTRMRALAALDCLCRDETHETVVAETGGIAAMLTILAKGSTQEQQLVVTILARMCSTAKTRNAVVAAGAIPWIVGLANGDYTSLREEAMIVPREASAGSPIVVGQIIAAGGLPPTLGVPSVVAFLSQGSEAKKQSALWTLLWLSHVDSDNHRKIADAGGIAPLIQLVANGTEMQRDYAMLILCYVAVKIDAVRIMIVEEGGLVPLIQLVGNGTEKQKECAARTLGLLSSNMDANRVKIADAGGIAPLVQLVANGTDKQKEHAALALGNVATKIDANQVAIADAGGIAPLVHLVANGTEEQKDHALLALGTIAFNQIANILKIVDAHVIPLLVELMSNGTNVIVDIASSADRTIQTKSVDAGGVPPLVQLVRGGTDKQKEHAALALARLGGKTSNDEKIAEAGGIAPLVELEAQGSEAQAEYAALAVGKITTTNHSIQAKVVLAGAIAPLVQLMANGSEQQKECATRALGNITSKSDTIQAMVADAGGVAPLVQLVATGTQEQKEYAVLTLANISRSIDSTEAKIVDAGGITPLVQVVATGTEKQKDYGLLALCNIALCNDVRQVKVAHAGGSHRSWNWWRMELTCRKNMRHARSVNSRGQSMQIE
ncbi:TPA: LOW QUALITY PROTEIN: hypothetical protein N0F65_003518 [Lagenidium giganteum]|uniref:Protein kinase domain-containing protein n=1 Tax=Lagenidium giganteum TaxID=4803 RepID=A0AAV2Z1T1_9STRA|nr:TPA: LOW QUALITY PROTEIN: hypothetical protein N0F65_003518 [Lagenidium giganteum]